MRPPSDVRKQVGVVWHPTTGPLSDVLRWLPHVDFAAVLGIPEPGRSGQLVMEVSMGLGAHPNLPVK